MKSLIRALWNVYKPFVRAYPQDNNFYHWFNKTFQDTPLFVIDKETFPVVRCKYDGLLYYVDRNLFTVKDFYILFPMPQIKPEDICIDLGANIGVFAMSAAKTGAKVVAVEPVTPDQLKRNLALNGITNVEVIPKFIGDSGPTECTWLGETRTTESVSFRELKDKYGCTVLKSNCEGGEWTIRPEDLEGVRIVAIEFHYNRGYKETDLYDYVVNNYDVHVIDYPTSKVVVGTKL